MKNRIVLITLFILLCNSVSWAQTWLWGVQGSTGLKSDIVESNLATNLTGNVYQAGDFTTSITFGTTTLTSSAEGDVFLVKYDQNGNLLWARQSSSKNHTANGFAVATDDSDNSYVTGNTSDTSAFGTDTLFETNQVFLVKYDANGNVVWATQPGKTLILPADYSFIGSAARAVALDKRGHEYIAGDGVFLIKYDHNGNIMWTAPQRMGYNHNSGFPNTAYSIAPDSFGNVYLTGVYSDTMSFGPYHLYAPYNSNGTFIAKFDSNGHVLWAQQSTHDTRYPQQFNDGHMGSFVATDNSGAAYLTGTFQDSIRFGSHNFICSNNYNPNFNFFVVKFNPDGTIDWGKQGIGATSDSLWGCYSICTDDSCHIYIGGEEGQEKTASFVFSNDTFTVHNPHGDYGAFLLKLDSSGNVICGSTINGGGYTPNAVAADASGKFVYLGGGFSSTLTFNTDVLNATTGGYATYIGRWQSCNTCNLSVGTNLPATLCSGQSDTLTATGGTSYTWNPSTGLSATTGNSVVANPTVTTTYTIVGSIGSCSGTVQAIVTVIQSPNQPTFSQHNDTLISSSLHDNQWYRNGRLLNNDTSRYLVIDTLGWYYVQVNNEANGCSTASDSADISSLTGIKQLSVNSEQLKIYPNPTSNQLIVESGQMTVSAITITNLLGQTMLRAAFPPSPLLGGEGPGVRFDVSALPDGLYFITVNTDTVMVTEKFIISK